MTNLYLIQAIADEMEAEGWQERSDVDRCAEAAKRYADVVSRRRPPPGTAPPPSAAPVKVRADGQYEMVFDG